MEGRIFAAIATRVRELGKLHSFKGKRFGDAAVVITALRAALWDRPMSWACRRENRPAESAGIMIPSPSTVSGRLRTVGVLTLLEQARSAPGDLFPPGLCQLIDSKPLAVSLYSKDRDAKLGHGAGLPMRV